MKVIVREGDTLWYLSQLFDVPLPLVLDSNPSINPDQLAIGEKISIPGYVKQSITLEKGDTIWGITTERHISLDALILMNPGIDPRSLQIGATFYVPTRVTRMIIQGKERYDYAMMMRDLNRLHALYPFLQQRSIGRSVLGKSIPEVTVGRGKKAVHVNGSFHAREWITTPVVMTFLNHYLLALTNRTTIRGLSIAPFYDQKLFSVVPMVNPDGVDLVLHGLTAAGDHKDLVRKLNQGSTDFKHWKANIRGVDLNDQFPADWEIEAKRGEQNPAPANYSGPTPLSEPESRALSELTEERDFNRVIALHTQGEVNYWGFEGYEPPESEKIATEFARVSGYEPVQYIDSYAGYKDWFIQKWRRPGFTVELGEGESPLPLSQFDEIYQESLGIFLANFYM